MKPATWSRRTVLWAFLIAVGLLVPAGFLAGLMLSPERLDGVGDLPEPLVVPVEEVLYDEKTGVSVTLQWAEGPALFSPAWSGTVGRVEVDVGDVLESGDTIATIDGVDRMAVATPQPFYRPLGRGDSGEDVTWLQEVLVQLGYLDELASERDTVTSDVLEAVRGLAEDLGVRGRVDAFDPAWFVWMPDDSFPVDRVGLVAGGQAPPAGNAMLWGPPSLADVTIQPLAGGVLQLAPDTRYKLMVEGVNYPIDPATSGLTAEARHRLATAVPPLIDSVAGTVLRVDPMPVWAVPSAAIQTGEDGRTCLWTESRSGFLPMSVGVVAGRAGVTFVQPAGSTGVRILVNPAQVLEDPTCPSA